ncbi:MAG: D-alanine--D-alanine ligase [Candidatus Aenigmatarchaeota archaeon]
MDVVLNSIKIGVLGGGVSEERDISLISANEAFKALKRKNLNVVFIDIFNRDKEKIKEMLISSDIDLAFIALHGEFGEDGQIQNILEEMGILYTGSGPLASYLAMNKIASKKIFFKEKIPTPNFIVWDNKEILPSNLRYPVVVKPYFSGSSLGVSIVWKEYSLKEALNKAFSLQEKVILEDYIEGRELTVGILKDKPLGVVEIIPKTEFYDFTTKYSDNLAEFIAPAHLESSLYKEIQEIALRAHKALGCRHFSRVDIRLSRDNIPYVLEVNSIPGLTSHSLLPLSAKSCGIDFDNLILEMVLCALYEKKSSAKV